MSAPKSVVFETAPPQYAFYGVAFETSVKLVDQHKSVVKGWSTALAVTLRYHDTYDVVQDQTLLQVDPHATTIDANSGICQLHVLINTLSASCEGRTFCLEVRPVDGDLECAFSSPIFVVKEKLTIVQQPPDVWFKDEGGREKCMVVSAVLESAPGTMLEDRVVPLQLRLLYESGTAVLNQSILRLFPDMRPNMTRGRISISFRIDDVSKNHQGQSFMLEIAPEKQANSQMFQDIAPARTSVIAIRSKRNKRKLNGATPRSNLAALSATPRAGEVMMVPSPSMSMAGGPGQPPSRRPRHLPMVATVTTPVNNPYMVAPQTAPGRMGQMMMPAGSVTWSSHIQPQQQAMVQTVQSPAMATRVVPAPVMAAQWRLAGFEIQPDGTPNVSRPLYRCSQCRRLADVDMMNQGSDVHEAQCAYSSANRFGAQGPVSTAAPPPNPVQQQVYANTTPRGVYPQAAVVQTSNSMNGSMIAPLSTTVVREASPKNMQAAPTGIARPTLTTISPFMNKVAGGEGTTSEQQSSSESTSAGMSTSGNLFASTAFRTQMGLNDSLELPSPTTDDKFAFLNKPLAEKSSNEATEIGLDPLQSSRPSETTSALNDVRDALQEELTSMGISIDSSLTKSSMANVMDTGTPLPDFTDFTNELGEEEHVFYILAQMYTSPQGHKVGLPAFDQFQRMVGFYKESQSDVQTQVLFHSLAEVGLSEQEQMEITNTFARALEQDSDAVHSLPKYQHNVVLLREDALMYHWSRSIQMLA